MALQVEVCANDSNNDTFFKETLSGVNGSIYLEKIEIFPTNTYESSIFLESKGATTEPKMSEDPTT